MTEHKNPDQEKLNKQILNGLMDIYKQITSNDQPKLEFEISYTASLLSRYLVIIIYPLKYRRV